MKKKKIFSKKLIISAIFMSLFIILSITIFTGLFNLIDGYVESFFIGIRNDKLTKIMINITNIGGAYSLIVISILLLFFLKKKKNAIYIMINLVSVFVTSQIFKAIFRRARPDGLFLTHASGFSYPSGHTMVSMAYFAFITYLFVKKIDNKLTRITFIIFSSILIILIGFSRIYLGVHYLSDVIGGLLLGTSYLMIFLEIIDKEVDKK